MLSLYGEAELCLFDLVPLDFLPNHFVVSLPPELAKLVELVDLQILHLHKTVLALPDLLARLNIFFRTARAHAPRAEVTVVTTHQDSVELAIAQLTVRLVLLRSLHVVSELNSGDQLGVQ